jgi:hypothetical protein
VQPEPGPKVTREAVLRAFSLVEERNVFQARAGGWDINLNKVSLTDEEAAAFAKYVLRPWLAQTRSAIETLNVVDNPSISSRGFCAILAELHETPVGTLKAYKTSINDAALRAVAQWILQSGRMPLELHISHCAVTDAGIKALFDALRTRAQSRRPDPPLWVHLRGNYGITNGLIKELVESGEACLGEDRRLCRPECCGSTVSYALAHLIGSRFTPTAGPQVQWSGGLVESVRASRRRSPNEMIGEHVQIPPAS